MAQALASAISFLAKLLGTPSYGVRLVDFSVLGSRIVFRMSMLSRRPLLIRHISRLHKIDIVQGNLPALGRIDPHAPDNFLSDNYRH